MYLVSLYIVVLLLTVTTLGTDVDITIDSECRVSNLCQRQLVLKAQDKNNPGRSFDISDKANRKNTEEAWKAVSRQPYRGQDGSDVTLTITARGSKKDFELRELRVRVRNVKVINVDICLSSGGCIGPPIALPNRQRNWLSKVLKKSTDEHFLVKSVSIKFLRLRDEKILIKQLHMVACCDKTGSGPVTKPFDAEAAPKSLVNPLRDECIHEYLLTYDNRDEGIVTLGDTNQHNALQTSGNTYFGESGSRVVFSFTAEPFPGHNMFLWWRVCLLIRYVEKITFKMEGDIDAWLEHITVCDPENYLWICYNPSDDRVGVLEKGHVTLYPESGSGNRIEVKDMSIGVCFDNEFTSPVKRIETIPCERGVDNKFCRNTVRISQSDVTHFIMSDDPKSKNTSSAWDIVRNQKQVFRRKLVVSYVFRLTNPCGSMEDGRFQIRNIQFRAQFIEGFVIRYCDTEYPNKKDFGFYCKERRGFVKWGRLGEGNSKIVTAKKPNDNVLYEVDEEHVVTAINITIVAKSPDVNPMAVWRFSVLGCCDKFYGERIIPIILLPFQKPKVGEDKCTHLYKLVHSSHPEWSDVFNFDDMDTQRDQSKALLGSGQEYVGPNGNTVFFDITFDDFKTFELWKICGKYLNIRKVHYIMEGETLTFVQTKQFCQLQQWQTSCYQPENHGLIVKRVIIMFEVVPGRRGRIKDFELHACRDHFHYEYCIHIHPCDYVSITIDRPGNQKITVYGSKNEDGHLVQTELYHFTDNTGNDGDNTWFMVDPKYSLVTAIWTKNTYIKLTWDIRARRVTFEIFIASEVEVRTIVSVLDLHELKELDPRTTKFNFTRTPLEPSEHCVPIPFNVAQCGETVTDLRLSADVTAKKKFLLPARFLADTNQYEFLLPEESFEDNTNAAVQRQCGTVTETFRTECGYHSIFNRIQHQFICDHIEEAVRKHGSQQEVDISRVYQACLFTYKTIHWTCNALTTSPDPFSSFFFSTACEEGKICIRQLYQDLFDGAPVSLKASAKDLSNRDIVTNPAVVEVNLRGEQTLTGITKGGEFSIKGVTKTLLEEDESEKQAEYEICVVYVCPTGESDEKMTLLPLNFSGRIIQCRNLDTSECCVTITVTTEREVRQDLAIRYSTSKVILVREEAILLP